MDKKSKTKSVKTAEKVAIFRYGIIAPVLNDPKFKQTRYFKEMAQKFHDVPGI